MNISSNHRDEFIKRHISPMANDTQSMLSTIGVKSIDQLIDETIPSHIRLKERMRLPEPQTEAELLNMLSEISSKNKIYKNFIGSGYYGTHTPNVILRNIFENPGWYTAYTPYQAEIAQGRLEALLNYQTMIIDLTGMEIANASLLDEATAAAEAMHMFHAESKNETATKFFVSELCFPQTIDVLKTRTEPIGVELVIGDHNSVELDETYFGALLQYPAGNGEIIDYSHFMAKAIEKKVMVAVAADLLSLTLLTPPGEWGADAVLGCAQRFGVPMGYGGPHAGYFATKDAYKRQMPGRLIGVSIDAQGNSALRMALQTREQHIKREKATSNICTAQVLLSIMASMYGVYHGPKGLKGIASRIHGLANELSDALHANGLKQKNKHYFDTLLVEVPSADKALADCVKAEINIRKVDDKHIGISLDETHTINDVNALVAALTEKSSTLKNPDTTTLNVPSVCVRRSDFMTHPIFNSHHSEHEMLRYIKYLESKDLSLCHSMIALGSCTMKLNATAEMIPVTMPGFGQLHPFIPRNQATGYTQIFEELSDYLKQVTGFPGMSLQPNSGASGEYAGLMVIREYLKSIGQGHRNIALIPSSAHGTNPASATMAGMKVVVTKTLDNGYVDIDDLREKAELHKDNLACLMVTYPSTYGVFEERIIEICDMIHKYGGQVYMDGANMNAQVGLTSPANIGADVCHLNLHKTFCIPHGGGGPGMGPIAVAKHLAPFLSVDPYLDGKANSVSSAPFGSALITTISWMYIRMMGASGIRKATEIAILNANYVAKRLENHFPILYKGENGRIAHECILDLRHLKGEIGITAEDVAKRLMDYGFHAPTLSFPVADTLMVEPTESESKAELDRFCEAMIAIAAEIQKVRSGAFDKLDNPLKCAPHTAQEIAGNWSHGYSREEAAYPLAWVRTAKFWPSVNRIDNAAGDRNLVGTCPPIEAYA